jgi:hypothetical protein
MLAAEWESACDQLCRLDKMVDNKLTLGYLVFMKDQAVSKAARAMAKRSVEARRKAWGEEEFIRRMHVYGKLGGRPRGAAKERQR